MKKSDLEKVLKPLIEKIVEEKVKKMILEEQGVLSRIISEVAVSIRPAAPVPAPVQFDSAGAQTPGRFVPSKNTQSFLEQKRASSTNKNELKKKMLAEVAKNAYAGVDVFEGTKELTEAEEEANTGVDLDALAKLGAFKF